MNNSSADTTTGQNTTQHTTAPSTTGFTSRIRPSSPESPLDLVIVGAGISGVDLAHHVHNNFPDWEWIAVDSNTDISGTWNTFRYPGIRSDSDMATFAFPFKPWPHPGTLGSGSDIREYVREVAREAGMLDRLQLSTWVQRANFHTDTGLWSLHVFTSTDGADMSEGGRDGVVTKEETIWTRRVHFAAGYYRHISGFQAKIAGLENFSGHVIHPQSWPEDLDVRAKKIVVIGSGATAVTLTPALHSMGADVTMLQRTPTYIAPLMETDMISTVCRAILPNKHANRVARNIHIGRDMAQYHMCQTFPKLARGAFWLMNRRFVSRKMIRDNFTPPYNPWDQRVCKAPDGDIFRAINDGAKVVTGHIEHVQERGIQLQDGRFIDADIIVTATGLKLQAFGGAEIAVDGRSLTMDELVSYRGLMMHGVPNFSYTVGYLNQSWTLRADMTSRYMVTLWKQLEAARQAHQRGQASADNVSNLYSPVLPEGAVRNRPLLDMESGYIQRAINDLPKQGDKDPWHMKQDYIYESRRLLHSDNNLDMVYGHQALDVAKAL